MKLFAAFCGRVNTGIFCKKSFIYFCLNDVVFYQSVLWHIFPGFCNKKEIEKHWIFQKNIVCIRSELSWIKFTKPPDEKVYSWK